LNERACPPRPVQRRKPGIQMASKASERPGSSRSKSGNKRGAQEISPSTGYNCDEVPAEPIPLKQLITEAVRRWFEDTLIEAQRGDVKQQALLGQMYAEGYGCTKNAKAAKEWSDKAAARGYRMQGVYCEL